MLTHEVRSGAFRGFFNPFKCRNVLSIVDFIQITHHNEISFDKEQWEEDSQIGQFSSSKNTWPPKICNPSLKSIE